MPTPIDPQNVFTIGNISLTAILILLITIFIRHRLTISRDKQKRKKDAAEKFRTAFVDEISILSDTSPNIDYWSESNDTATILENSFVKHQKAVVAYRPHLNAIQRIRFNRAWKKYHVSRMLNNETDFVQYGGLGTSTEASIKGRKLALKRINKLFSFAKD